MLFKEGKILLTRMGIKFNKTGEIPEGWENTKLLSEEEGDGPSVRPARAPKKEAPAEAEWVDKPFVPKTKTSDSTPKKREEKKEFREPREEKPQSDRPKKTLTFKGK
jgi:hypothetical protein